MASCFFLHNSGFSAGVIDFDPQRNSDSALIATRCTFSENDCLSPSGDNYASGVLNARNSGTAIFQNCTFDNNWTSGNGAVAMVAQNFQLVIEHCICDNNTASGYGGCFAITDAASLEMTSSLLSDNRAVFGGAVASLGEQATVAVLNSLFLNNSAISGGAIILENGAANVSQCTFLADSALSGGVAALSGFSALLFNGCVVSECKASGVGGVVHLTQTSFIDISDSSFTNNFAASGGVVSSTDASSVVVSNCNMTLNYAVVSGGVAVVDTFGQLRFQESRLTANYALTGAGGVVYARSAASVVFFDCEITENFAPLAGVVYLDDCANLAMLNVTAHQNMAVTSGGVFASSGVTAETYAGRNPVAQSVADLTKLLDPLLLQLGVQPNLQPRDFVTVSLNSSVFTDNVAQTGDGGVGCAYMGDLQVAQSAFSGNRALVGSGGALVFDDARGNTLPTKPGLTFQLESSEFSANQASESGGAMLLTSSLSLPAAAVLISGCIFQDNAARRGGACFSNAVSFVDIVANGSTSSNNTASLYGASIATFCTHAPFLASNPVSIFSGGSVSVGGVRLLDGLNQLVQFDTAAYVSLRLFDAAGDVTDSAIAVGIASVVPKQGTADIPEVKVFGHPGSYALVPTLFDGTTTSVFLENALPVTIAACPSDHLLIWDDLTMFSHCVAEESANKVLSIVLSVIAGWLILGIFGCLIVVHRCNDHKIILIAGETWCQLLGLASALCFLQLFFRLQNRPSDALCGVILWSGHLAYVLGLSTIASKLAFSKPRSFSTARNFELRVNTVDMIRIVGGSVLTCLTLLAIWTAVYPSTAEIAYITANTVTFECAFGHAAFSWTMYALEICLLLACSFLSLRLRSIMTLYDDGRYLLAALRSTTTIAAAGWIVSVIFGDQLSVSTVRAIESVCFLAAGALLVGYILGPKMHSIHARSWKTSGAGREAVICYTFEDRAFMKKLGAGLAHYGIDAWFDEMRLEASAFWRKEVAQTIQACRVFIFIVSPHSVTSNYCLEEIQFAYDHGKVIFPVIKDRNFDDEIDPGLDMLLKRFQWIFFDGVEQSAKVGGDDELAPTPAAVESAGDRTLATPTFDEQAARLAKAIVKQLQESGSAILDASDQQDRDLVMVDMTAGEKQMAEYLESTGQLRTSATGSTTATTATTATTHRPLHSLLSAIRSRTRGAGHSHGHSIAAGIMAGGNLGNSLAAKLKPKEVFVSWAHADAEFVRERLWPDLEARQLDCWIDFLQLEAGEFWRKAIGAAIKHCRVCLFVLTPTSVRSQYCQEELLYASKCGKRIVVVMVKPCKKELADTLDVKAVIDASAIVDFSDSDLYHINVNMLSSLISAQLNLSQAAQAKREAGTAPGTAPVRDKRASSVAVTTMRALTARMSRGVSLQRSTDLSSDSSSAEALSRPPSLGHLNGGLSSSIDPIAEVDSEYDLVNPDTISMMSFEEIGDLDDFGVALAEARNASAPAKPSQSRWRWPLHLFGKPNTTRSNISATRSASLPSARPTGNVAADPGTLPVAFAHSVPAGDPAWLEMTSIETSI
ncbi:hypothetical protein, variant [Capsaspora owczarzaki ATCC 30864]|nr:hypothetical protein, variant [Capsaspora owczarzaki ATCC 30864]